MRYRLPYPTIKRPIAKWERQAYGVSEKGISLSFLINGKANRILVPAIITDADQKRLSDSKLGGLRITKKRGNYIAQIGYTPAFPQVEENGKVMGVDLGIKCPAVAKTSDGKVQFFGNGRERRAKRRMFKGRRKHLQKRKHRRKLKRIEHKERRWMIDQDHKLSREIINYAIKHGIKTIKMEMLSGIRKRTTSKSRKNSYSINSWSFYRLQQFIVYKARLAGIRILFVDPRYTSQICPNCGNKHKASDRLYRCPECGYTKHRDLIGAINILAA
jgi:putative transposase